MEKTVDKTTLIISENEKVIANILHDIKSPLYSIKIGLQSHLDNGEDVFLIIEIQGAMKIKELLPETLFIFILPPSMKELKNRLENRKTETKEKIDKRFKQAYTEINEVSKYNYVVVNDEVENAAMKIDAILTAEKCRVDRIEEVYLNTEEETIHETLSNKEFQNEEKTI